MAKEMVATTPTNIPPKPRTSFKPTRTWEPLHTGGQAALSPDGQLLCTTLDDQVAITDVQSGERVDTLRGDSSAVTALACTTLPVHAALLVAHRSLSLRLYSLSSTRPTLLKSTPNAHEAPIVALTSDPTSALFATGDASGVVKVWDSRQGHCTHVFRGHGGVVSALFFDVDEQADKGKGRARLVVGSGDCRVRVWDLVTRKLLAVLEGHSSVVRGVAVTKDGETLVSGGRDKVVNVWDMSARGKGRLKRTIPVYDTLEAVGLVYAQTTAKEDGKGKGKARDAGVGRPLVYVGGEKGVLSIWDVESGECIAKETREGGKPAEIFDARLNHDATELLVNRIDQNLSIISLPSLEPLRQIVGFNDEIVDLCLLNTPSTDTDTEPSYLAAATNSPSSVSTPSPKTTPLSS